MNTSRAALDRLLDPENPSVTLHTLHSAAKAVGGKLNVSLEVPGGTHIIEGKTSEQNCNL